MREFEANSQLDRSSPFQPGLSPEQRAAAWRQMVERDDQRHRQQNLEVNNTYLGQARQLRDEIVYRLKIVGIFSPYVDLSPVERVGVSTLDDGMLAGPHPITLAANYLEKLARRLP